MSVTDNSHDKSKLPEKPAGGSEKYVFGFIVLMLAALAAYQVFFCPNCYAMSDRTAVQSTPQPEP